MYTLIEASMIWRKSTFSGSSESDCVEVAVIE
ncbi:DUF397 domain-containing protein [Actinoallomurus spadix]|nr:DUF397 domain-containing protein [Actinoallomurus spadix]MCO5988068.1 DUF397 domain-containing protein [Actinoallomurus spadix]